jgi:plastocyanin domain-containing protein
MTDGIRAMIGVFGLSLVAAIGCSKSEGASSRANSTVTAQGSTKVTVDGQGFTPSEVHVEKGKPLSLVFLRTTDSTCATEVVFPELKLKKDLPLNTPVAIDVPTEQTRTLAFQCGMGMYRSAVVIQ